MYYKSVEYLECRFVVMKLKKIQVMFIDKIEETMLVCPSHIQICFIISILLCILSG